MIRNLSLRGCSVSDLQASDSTEVAEIAEAAESLWPPTAYGGTTTGLMDLSLGEVLVEGILTTQLNCGMLSWSGDIGDIIPLKKPAMIFQKL